VHGEGLQPLGLMARFHGSHRNPGNDSLRLKRGNRRWNSRPDNRDLPGRVPACSVDKPFPCRAPCPPAGAHPSRSLRALSTAGRHRHPPTMPVGASQPPAPGSGNWIELCASSFPACLRQYQNQSCLWFQNPEAPASGVLPPGAVPPGGPKRVRRRRRCRCDSQRSPAPIPDSPLAG